MARTSGRPGGVDELVSELVNSSQRRDVVQWLAEHGQEADFETLTDAIGDSPDETMTAIRLHHVHLPKLASTGAIEWDKEADTIRLTEKSHTALTAVGSFGGTGQVADD